MDQSQYYNSHFPSCTLSLNSTSKMPKSHYFNNTDYWTMDRVIHWLEVNEFNRNVIDVFKARNICGRTFLDVDMSYLMTFQNELMLSYSDKRKLAHAIKALKAPEETHNNPQQTRSNYNVSRHNLTANSSSNNGQRYVSSPENITPLIPERKSSNNEHVLDWMKSFNIPKRPFVSTANVNNTIAATGASAARHHHHQHHPNLQPTYFNHTIANSQSGIYQHHSQHSNFPVSPKSPRIVHSNQLPLSSSAASTMSSNTTTSSSTTTDGSWKLARRRPTPAATSSTVNPLNNMGLNTALSYGDQTIHITPPPPPPPQEPQQFIHVTTNSDTFHSLQVTGMHDPRLIKNSIIRKLGLEGKCDNYRFFHENGKNTDIPLTDSELSHICQMSDHSATNRILVRPISIISKDDHGYHNANNYHQQYSPIVNNNSARSYSSHQDNQYTLNNSSQDNDRSANTNLKGQIAVVDSLNGSRGLSNDTYNEKAPNLSYMRKASIDITASSSTLSPIKSISKSNRSSTSSTDNRDFNQLAADAKLMDSSQHSWAVQDPSQSLHSPSSQHQEPLQRSSQPDNSLLCAPTKSPNETHHSSAAPLFVAPTLNTKTAILSDSVATRVELDKDAPVSLWAVPPSKPAASLAHSPTPALWAVEPKPQQQKPCSSADNSDKKHIGDAKPVSLWTVSPSNQHMTTSTSSTLKDEAAPVSLWAVPPSSAGIKSSATPSTPQPSLWAVPPQTQGHFEKQTRAESSSSSNSSKTSTVSLWAVSPSKQQQRETKEHTKGEGSAVKATTGPSDTPTLKSETSDASSSVSQSIDSLSMNRKKDDESGTVSRNRIVQFETDEDESHILSSASSVASAPELKDGIEQLSISSTSTTSDEEDETREQHEKKQPAIMHRHMHSRSNSASKLHIDITNSLPNRSVGGEENNQNILDSPNLSSPSHSGSALDPINDEENWAERPSVDRLYKDIDKYLPGHDLDKEIIINESSTATSHSDNNSGGNSNSREGGGNNIYNSEPETPTIVTSLPPNRKLVGHRKSIRNVAREAHRNWRNAVNVIRANNNLIRRRSTKMWHRNVEQVKPGDKIEPIIPQNSENETAASTTVAELEQGQQQVRSSPLQQNSGGVVPPKSKKLQWIRGELIGKGSFGRVYHALNVEAGEWIAVKQVDLPNTKSDYGNTQLNDMKDALYREISLLEDLDNEYVVQYLGYDVDHAEGYINIFLEYVPGGSIASCLAKTGKFEVPLVRFFTRQILMGVAYLHSRNVLHRDIKAGNILLDQNGVCKITDFGLSKLSGQDKAYDPHSNNSVMRGTVFWMAPEVVKGTKYNAKVDIWSLGCTVIEMLTGKHPWLDLNMLAALYSLGKYQAPPIPEGIPDDVCDFLEKCFTINPEERPTAEQLLLHPFVQPDPTFEFKKYMKKVELERRQSRKLQQHQQQHQQFHTKQPSHTIPAII
ncbi:hypothetical protein BDF20DRAFT_846245 [Mycotypha africana]|uniref:uncharacterized protein n=1 Tax=Mycotypha africana TaxID=64632 RepID=UPI0023006AB1|nr:uncharacterized protein BDF20DRAFT_846245 [Mycotypha africana]KAI8991759.1 hypothetical protein BDF20DRAFT_846245 [Mycotypha africana]